MNKFIKALERDPTSPKTSLARIRRATNGSDFLAVSLDSPKHSDGGTKNHAEDVEWDDILLPIKKSHTMLITP